MPRLVVVAGPDAGRQFPVAGPVVGVGRHSGSPVHLTDTQVSRRHLELRATPAGYDLVDLGSGNGTRVNGQPVTAHALRPGDEIALGETVLRFADDADAPSVRFTATPEKDFASAIVRTVPEAAGGQLLARPEDAGTDWLRTRLANLAVLYEAANVVSHVLDVDDLLARILDLVVRAADADHGCFLLADPDTGELMPRAVRSRPGPAAAPEFAVSRTVVEYVRTTRQGVLASDAAADARFRGGESILRNNIREVIAAPMRGRHQTVGVLYLDALAPARPVGAADLSVKFTGDHLNLAVAVAHQAALAVEEARYYSAFVAAEKLAAVGQTIAALSHHIKNIMQGVRFGGDMVRMALADDDKELLAKGWSLVEKNQGRIDDLILDMLSYSKDREPAAEPTDLSGLVDDVLEVVRGRAATAGVELAFARPAGLPPVPLDPEGIHRALLNVVSNAVDAAAGRPGARVEVSVRADAADVELAVEDNGPGIPEEKLADIFKPFVSTKGSRGTGLGLPVSRKVMEEHGGSLTAGNRPGGGARFVFRLPRGGAGAA